MYGVKLIQLANLLGLSQSAIARHLDLGRARVNDWARGVKQIPEKYLAEIAGLVVQAMDLTIYHLAVEPLVPGKPLERQKFEEFLAKSALSSKIAQLVFEVIEENQQIFHLGYRLSLDMVLEDIATLRRLPPHELRKVENADRMIKLGAYLQNYGRILSYLSPILNRLPEEQLCPPMSATL